MAALEAQPPPSARWISYRSLSILVSGLLLLACAAVLYYRVDRAAIEAVWARLDALWLTFAIAVFWLQYPLNSIRLHRVLLWTTSAGSRGELPFSTIFRLTCVSGFIAVAAPLGAAGDLAKVVGLRMLGAISTTDAARCTVFDRALGAQWTAVTGLLTLPLQAATGVSQTLLLAQVAVFTGILAGAGLLLVAPRLIAGSLLPKTRILDIFEGYGRMLAPAPRSALQFVLLLLNLALVWGAVVALMLAAGLSGNLLLVALFIPLLQLINSIPFLYMGWGGREIVVVATFGAAGDMSVNEALALSAAWGVALMVASAVNGVFLIGRWRGRKREALVSS